MKKPEQMPEIPERIWLRQWNHNGIWYAAYINEPVLPDDIEYVRADLAKARGKKKAMP